MEIDAKYAADLAKDPAAALWLSVYHEEVHKGIYIDGEPHIHTLEQVRELDRERKARAANMDVMSWGAYRGRSLDTGGKDPAKPAALALLTAEPLSAEEDRRIAAIDRRRSLVLRQGGKE